jgi:hypothetical protein
MNDTEKNELDSKLETKTDWKVFYAAMLIVLGIIAYLFTQINSTQAQVVSSTASVENIQFQLGEIQTDVVWIKSNLSPK